MPQNDLLKEAEKRGLLNKGQASALVEARKRGLVGTDYAPIPGPIQHILPDRADQFPERRGLAAVGRRADDIARSVASGATFGLADEAAAAADALTGTGTYEENLARERETDRNIPPHVSLGGEVLGAVATGAALGRGGVSLLANAPKTLPSLATRGAGEGAIYGALHGFGHGEGLGGRVEEGLQGGLTGGLTGGILGGLTRGLVGGKAQPTVQTVKDQAQKAYRAAEQAGVIVKADRFGTVVNNIERKLAKAGFDRTLHPNTYAALQRLQEGRTNNQTLEGMEILRRVVSGAKLDAKAADAQKASIMLREIDDFVGGMKPTDVLAGPTIAATKALKEGRSLWHTASKTETIHNIVEKAKNRAGQFSGSGYENALRTEFRGLLRDKKVMGSFNQTEREFIRKVARGTPLSNAMRWLGKLAPTGVVSSALSAGLGYGVAGPGGAIAAPAAGLAGRAAATGLTKGNVGRVLDEVLGPVTKKSVTISAAQAQMLRSALVGAEEAGRAAIGARKQSPAEIRPLK